jgi:GTPase
MAKKAVAEGTDVEALYKGLIGGERSSLARAITLVESTRKDHIIDARKLLSMALKKSGGSRRIGITGAPGVGKSTFIEKLGTMLTEKGHRVAVLAVDPTSSKTGGSILGDKTRMTALARDKNAFVRPTASSGYLGGVARMTRGTITLLEAAGFDVVMIETLGTGQSEYMVANMVDFFMVLMLPGAGDELQGIKKGVLELADMIVINKADGENQVPASMALRDYKAALHIIRSGESLWSTPVLKCSSITGDGIEAIWQQLERHRIIMDDAGETQARRSRQNLAWMKEILDERLKSAFLASPDVAALMPNIMQEVEKGELTATLGADKLLDIFWNNDSQNS